MSAKSDRKMVNKTPYSKSGQRSVDVFAQRRKSDGPPEIAGYCEFGVGLGAMLRGVSEQ